ncbi:KICSTOR complex protein ITFG2-like isoform X3 [Eurytemora carolleeae]|uniref:KICSTOR complex protein ITFG2-like isoform X3 n=1 Tax=Eurytemora carolleeae TaxID=1294199 RepID=UPI000C774275|nr:KICSTOR complex protein ITFG2-like isoform X3 [Eurytemora carolleeae]|eukprot:XP_023340784.1 KICSTOR complex protein ITFG2-like isoform X3 [Eurytemora affinis]
MRAVTFVDRLTLEIPGSVAQCGIFLADVNDDGESELIVGTTEGDLFIYKGRSGNVWKKASNLGFITAISVGDLFNMGYSVLVVATGCGWVNVFDFSKYSAEDEFEPTFKQRVPANIRDMIISDVTHDGLSELVISLTDRVVRMYRWTVFGLGEEEGQEKEEVEEKDEDEESPSSPVVSPTSLNLMASRESGRLVCINKWEFASQIGTVSMNKDSDGKPAILIGQPGGAFLRLRCRDLDKEGGKKQEDTGVEIEESENPTFKGLLSEEDSLISSMSVEYEPLGINRRANPNVSSEILGGFETEGKGTRFAITTLDGSILLVDDDSKKKSVDCIMWNLQVDHQIMCLSKLDITGNKSDEVIACSWDGQTYIISQDKQAVRFKFEESVSTFTAGRFTLGPENTQPVLVYVTLSNKIQIYYNLCLGTDLTLSSLIHYPPMLREAGDTLKSLGCEPGNLAHLRQIYNYCLYGLPDSEL